MRKITLLLLFMGIFHSMLFSQTYNVPSSGSNTITVCSGTVYDNGGTGNYSNSAYGTLTINPQTTGNYVSLSFSSFSVESCCDNLSIYDGTSTSSPLIGTYTSNPGTVYATNSSGALTLRFSSDGSVTYSGFEATISCLTSIPLADLIIQTPSVSSSSIVAGSSVTASYTLKNQGAVSAASNYTGFYLSTDNVWDANDTYLSSQSVSSLSAGLSSGKSTTVTIPSSTSIGNYYLLFYADYANTVSEDNNNNNVNAVPITIAAPVFDYYISSVSLSSYTTAAGTNIYAYGYVYNQGNSSAPSTALGYYLSTDLTLDASDVYLTSLTTSTIYSGSYYYASQSLTIPSGTAAGSYYILYFADYSNTVSESNENNNVNAVGITVASSAKDLSVINSSASPSTIAYGSSSSVSFTLLNQSYQSTSSTSVGCYLSSDSAWDASDTYLSYYTTGAISANAFSSGYVSVTIPSSTTPGNYYILSYVDYTNSITETSENNNVYAVPVTINTPIIDLTILSPYLSSASVASGSSVSVYGYIYNQGTTSSSSSNVGYYLSSDNIFDAGDTYLSYSTGGTLSASSSSYKSASLTIPSSTTPGSYYILCFADYTSSVSESDETNNVYPLAITVTSSYLDLAITSPSCPASATAGNSISVNCYINNNGTGSATSSNIGFYLSTDNVFDAGDTYLNYSTGYTLSAGGSSYRSATLTIPSSTANGNYYILYFADYASQVIESNETNNVYAVAITIGTGGGGTTYNVPSSGSNTITTCSGTVYDNGGTSDYSSSANGSLTINPQTAGNYVVLSFASFSVEWGYDYLYIYNGTSTSAPLIGTYSSNPGTVYATDSSGALTLRFYSDGIVNYPGFEATISCVTSVPSSDLYIQSGASISSSSVAKGASVTSTCYIGNQGGTLASSSNVGYYLSADTVWDVSDTYLNFSSGSSLSVGSSSYKSATLTIPSGTTSGNYYILFFADYSGNVTEASETNNVKWSAVTVTNSLIDLAINSPYIGSSSLTAGSSVSSSCYVYNSGNTSAASSNVGYYLSADTVYDVSDVYLNYSTGGTLSAGGTGYRSSTLTIPSTTTAGNYYVLFYADYYNSVIESNETNNIGYLPVSIVAPVTDLSIINYYLSSSTVAQGANVTANCYIFNKGNISISSSNVGFYLSSDSVWNSTDVYLNYQYGGTLSANNYSSRAGTLTIPSGTASGNYYILYYADYSNQVVETNENNNIAVSPITVVSPVIDFRLLAPSVYSTNIIAGNSVSLSSSIFNTGNTSASSSNVGYYLSADTVFDASDTYLSSSTGSTLNAGTGSSRSASVTIPSSTVAGNYYILFFADYSYMVAESNENNNVYYYPISVAAQTIDLFIQTPSLSASSISAGGSITGYCSIYNQGNASASSSNVGYYLSADTVWNSSDTYLASYTGYSLSANSSSYRSYTLTIPSSTPNGNYYILFYADYTSVVSETTETNNVSYSPITVSAPFIDLVIQSTSASPSSVTAGSSVFLSCYIYNQGTSSASSSNVGYYLSADTAWDASDFYLSSYSSGGTLGMGSSAYRSSSPVIPSSTTAGSYYILYYADYANSVTESLETNNVAYRSVTVTTPSIDLIIQTPYLSSASVASGSTVTASCYSYNQGNSTASVSSVGFYLSTNTVFDASDVFLNYQSGGTLGAGSSSYRSSTLTIPSSTTPGTYYILYYVDYLNAQSETNENNNVNYASITVSAPNIDLTITLPYAPLSVTAGSSAWIDCYIYNQGNTSSSTSNVGYYLSANTTFDSSDVYLGYSSGYTLSAGVSSYRYNTLTIPSSTTPGTYYILYYADYLNAESETNENNNISSSAITVATSSVDLVIQTPYTSPSSVAAGSSVSVSCYIYNQGNSSASSSNVGYYLSGNSVWDTSDVYLGNSSGFSLSSGTSGYRYNTLTIPASTVPGSYYILYYADYSGVVPESNENNNTSSSLLTVTQYLSAKNMPGSGNDTMVTCAGVVYDPGGTTTYYSDYNTSTITIYPATSGNYVQLTFNSSFDIHVTDILSLYDGTTTSAPLLTSSNFSGATYAASNSLGALTLQLSKTGGYDYHAGFSATISCVTTLPMPDLVVQSPSAYPTSVSAGGTVSVSCSVYNQGTSTATSGNAGYYLSTNNVWDASDVYLSYSYGYSLVSGGSSYLSSTVTIPSGTATGNYYILYYADYAGSVSESNENNNVNSYSISVVTPSVDLVIQSPMVSPTSVTSGGSVYVSGYIYNQGNSIATSSNVGYYLSTNNVWDASDVYLSYTYGSSLSSGSSGYLSSTVTIPSGTAPGNYYLLYYADYAGSVSESNENNNVNSYSISVVTPSVDLVIQSPMISSTSVTSGGSVYVSGYIYNQGNSTATSSNVGYYLSADNVYDASDVYLSYSYGSSLYSGGSRYFSSTLTIPSGTVPGNYYLLYYADYSDVVSESNENNNVSSDAISVAIPTIDLLVQMPTAYPSSVTAGGSISITCYIANQGNSMATSSNVGYYLSTDNIWNASDVFLSSSAGASLMGGASSYSSTTVTIPSGTALGNYYILYYADYSNVVSESNESNNVSSFPVTVASYITSRNMLTGGTDSMTTCSGIIYDPGGTSSYYSDYNTSTLTIYPGTAGNYVRLTFDPYLDIHFSDILSIYDGTTTFAPLITDNVAGSGSGAFSATNSSGALTLQFSKTGGYDYHSGFSATVSCMSTLPKADLIVQTPLISTASAAAGDDIFVSCDVYNQGIASASSSNVGYYLSTNSVWDASDVYLYSSTGTALNSGEVGYSNEIVTIPSGTAAGNYYILFYADYANTVSEDNDNNNTGSAAITIVAPAVDMVIQTPSAYPTSVNAGGSVSVSCSVYNQGNSSATSSNVGYYLSADNVWDASDVYLSYSYGGSLNTGSSSYKSATLTIPSGTATGSYYILYYADYSDAVAESNENNNVNSYAITVATPTIDLLVQTPTAYPSSVTAGGSISITCYIANQGNSTAASGNVGYYLSTDNVWDASDVFLSSSTGTSLMGGSSSYKSATVTVPSGTASGNYFILYYADYSNMVSESNESNNVNNFAITVASYITSRDMLTGGTDSMTTCSGVVYDPGGTGNYYSDYNTSTITIYPGTAGNYVRLTFNSSFYIGYDVLSLYDGTSASAPLITNTNFAGSTYTSTNSSGALTLRLSKAGMYSYYSGFSATVSCVSTAPAPDLVIQSPSANSSSVSAGSSISVSCYVYNQGLSGCSSSNVGYYLSADNVWDVNDVYLDYSSGGTLEGGVSGYKSATLTIPSSTISGTYYILCRADYDAGVTELNETNNVSYLPIVVNGGATGILTSGTKRASVLLFPNPAQDHINVVIENLNDSESINIELLNISGQRIVSEKHEKVSGNSLITKLSVENISGGIYFVRIITKQSTSVSKIVIE